MIDDIREAQENIRQNSMDTHDVVRKTAEDLRDLVDEREQVLIDEILDRESVKIQALTDQLRKQKASISGNESGNMEQRRLFAELHKLLSCKLRAAKKIEEEKTGFSSSEFDMGGAKVMKIDQM